MSPTLDAFLRSWPSDPWLVAALVLTGLVYVRGWRALRRRDNGRWHAGQPAAFLGGLAALFVALASPVDPFAALFLQVHMVQHLLLMMVAPPLLWLGEPLFPLLRGLPRAVRVYWVAPLLRSPSLGRLAGWLAHPAAALVLFVGATWLWHAPPVYELALRSSGWHYIEHACFLLTALLFWYAVVRPYPARPRWSLWLLLPYLVLADVQNTALSALLTFSDRVLYPYYAAVPRPGGVSALADQAAAGVVMWVPGSLAFLVPLFWIAVGLLYGPERPARGARFQSWRERRQDWNRAPQRRQDWNATSQRRGRVALPLVNAASPHVARAGFDLLRVPVLGRFLRWRHARPALQLPLLALAGVVIFDGLRGPQVAAMNLAGVGPWIHWRGLVVLALLVAGNFFCMGCPFLLPRTIARRWLPAGWVWPRRLRNKWVAVLLLGLFLWAYEAFALWDSPWWTAWIALAYFAAAFAIDGLFRGAPFCKYLCPLGQFNFVHSLVSPLEVQVRDPAACVSCASRDCIRGRDGIPGCELHLYLPRKSGNMDCTFCLDCVHACPHDNVGILAVPRGRELWRDALRSGIGRFARRADLAALVVLLAFGAFTNAAGMVGPVVELRDRLGSPRVSATVSYLVALVVVPLLAVGAASGLSRRWGAQPGSTWEVANRYAFALVPLGFGMWMAHYGFHFLTSWDTILPTTQRLAADFGWAGLGQPEWVRSCCRPVADWLPRLEIVLLDVGLLLSLYAAYRIAVAQCPRPSQALRAFAPWGVLLVLLFAAGVWIVLQPMQMRGTLQG
jgi:cytochrome c oxidase assembly factor CtaG/polyferredoxin